MGAILSVDRKIVEVGRVFRLSGPAMIRRILLPAVLPAYVVSLRAGLGLGWMFVVAAEFMGASEGLGYLLVDGQQLGKPAQIVAAILAFAVLGKATDTILSAVAAPFLRKTPSARNGRARCWRSGMSVRPIRTVCARARRRVARGRARRDCRHRRRLRLRQVHLLRLVSRARPADPGHDHARRHGDREPARRSASYSRSRASCRGSPSPTTSASGSRTDRRRNARPALRCSLRASACTTGCRVAARAVGRPGPARRLGARAGDPPRSCSCSTSRSRRSTPSPGSICRTTCWTCGRTQADAAGRHPRRRRGRGAGRPDHRQRAATPGRMFAEVEADLPRPRDRQSAGSDHVKRRVLAALDRSLDRQVAPEADARAAAGAALWW